MTWLTTLNELVKQEFDGGTGQNLRVMVDGIGELDHIEDDTPTGYMCKFCGKRELVEVSGSVGVEVTLKSWDEL